MKNVVAAMALMGVSVMAQASDSFQTYKIGMPEELYLHAEIGRGTSSAYCSNSGCSDSTDVYGGGLGWHSRPWLAFEVGYLKARTLETFNSRTDAQFATMAALFRGSINTVLGGYIRAGVAYWDIEVNKRSGAQVVRVSGLSPQVGVGGFANLTDNFALRLEVSRILWVARGSSLGSQTAAAITLGLTASF